VDSRGLSGPACPCVGFLKTLSNLSRKALFFPFLELELEIGIHPTYFKIAWDFLSIECWRNVLFNFFPHISFSRSKYIFLIFLVFLS
jgi:hypothetical protein